MKVAINGQSVDLVDRIEVALTGANLAETRRRIATAFARLLVIMWVRGEIEADTAYELITGELPPSGTTVELEDAPVHRRTSISGE